MTLPQTATDVRGSDDPDVVLKVENLVKRFPIKGTTLGRKPEGYVHAVSDVSFEIRRGQTLSLVGESGCGKSTTARCILRLIEPTEGKVWFRPEPTDGDVPDMVDVTELDRDGLRRLRRHMQIVFQDPFASLNPRMSVEAIVREPLDIHDIGAKSERSNRVRELLDLVGLKARHARRHPQQFSGGQRQRIGIARALALNPSLLVLDEPVSALDVSVQAQVLNLLQDLQRQLGLTYLFIAHDLSVVRHMSDEVAVMYLGRIAEQGDRAQVFERPRHPYTSSLLSAVPVPDPASEAMRDRIILEGDIPSPANPPSGCRFRTRCPVAHVPGDCADVVPELEMVEAGHTVACHYRAETGLGSEGTGDRGKRIAENG